MKERLKKLHKQNTGSTLIIVLTVIAFLSILSVVVISSASLNYRMKIINNQSKEVFYTSENAVDEVHASLGQLTMEVFEDAYINELSNVVKHNIIGGYDVTYTQSSQSSNISMREFFMYQLVENLGLWRNGAPEEVPSVTSEGVYCGIYYNINNAADQEILAKFIAVLNSFLEEKSGLEIVSVGEVKAYTVETVLNGMELYQFKISVKDCTIKYLDENNYYSTIMFDFELSIPDIYFDFATDSKSGINSYENYSLIGNLGVLIDKGQSVNFTSSIYAGKRYGLVVSDNSKLNINGSDVYVIVGGDVTVAGGTLNINTSELWCTGIVTQKDDTTTGNNVLNINSSTYVKDDLQIEGDGDIVSISGEYYGYSYVGNNAQGGNHNNSSAIIVNGAGSKLSLSGITKMLLSGSAYIDYKNGADSYATGESLALKGSQEIYLVPSYLMSKANPVVGGTATVNINATNFFGFEYLDTVPYTTRTVTVNGKSLTYYYLNFKNAASVNKYVQALNSTDSSAWTELINGKEAGVIASYEASRDYILQVIEENLTSLNSVVDASNVNNVTSEANMIKTSIDASGNINPVIMIAGQTEITDTTDSYFKEEASRLSEDYRAWTTILRTLNPGETTDLTEYEENGVFNNIISMEQFSNLTASGSFMYEVPEMGGVILYATNNSTPLVVGNTGELAGYSKGIIVASGDVIVEKNFNGVIISGGKITVQGNGTTVSRVIPNTSVNDILNLGIGDGADSQIAKFALIFSEYTNNLENQELVLPDIDYSDFIVLSNWRKTYEEEAATESETSK